MSDIILRLRAPIDESSPVKLVWELLNQRKEAADELEQVWEMYHGLQEEITRLQAELSKQAVQNACDLYDANAESGRQ